MTTKGGNGQRNGSGRWLRAALVLSLGVNLAVAGVFGGLWLRGMDETRHGSPRAPVVRDSGFGPWSGALDDADRSALRRAFRDAVAEGRPLRESWRAEREDHAALVAALRSEPFDISEIDMIAARMRARSLERQELGHDLIRSRLTEMTTSERLTFADRLEASQRRPRDKGRPGTDSRRHDARP